MVHLKFSTVIWMLFVKFLQADVNCGHQETTFLYWVSVMLVPRVFGSSIACLDS